MKTLKINKYHKKSSFKNRGTKSFRVFVSSIDQDGNVIGLVNDLGDVVEWHKGQYDRGDDVWHDVACDLDDVAHADGKNHLREEVGGVEDRKICSYASWRNFVAVVGITEVNLESVVGREALEMEVMRRTLVGGC